MKTYKTLTPNYDVSGGNTSFDVLPFSGINFLEVQFFYTSLDQADHKLRLQESVNGVDFLDSVDSSGTTIEITIDNSLSTDILKVFDFNTAHYKFRFIEGTPGTGIIDKLMIVTE